MTNSLHTGREFVRNNYIFPANGTTNKMNKIVWEVKLGLYVEVECHTLSANIKILNKTGAVNEKSRTSHL